MLCSEIMAVFFPWCPYKTHTCTPRA